MASWEIRIEGSSGKLSANRLAICSGLHDLAQRRSLRGPWWRPIHRMSGPGTGPPSARVITPERRSLTYSRSCSFAASLDTLGRLARRSACHWAVEARYSRRYVRVEALRRSSREIVEGSRPRRRAISRTPICWACKTAMALALNKRQIPPRDQGQADRRHPATLAEPPGPDRRRDPRLGRGTTGDHIPEANPILTPRRRGSPRRPHLATHGTDRLLTLPNTHRTTSMSRCCDDRLNPPNTRV